MNEKYQKLESKSLPASEQDIKNKETFMMYMRALAKEMEMYKKALDNATEEYRKLIVKYIEKFDITNDESIWISGEMNKNKISL